MKKLLKSYTTFSRTERMGIMALCGLLLALLIIRMTMHLWVHPATDAEKDKKLVAAWEVFKRSQPVTATTDSTDGHKQEHQDATDANTAPLPDTINLNTADSGTLVRLKGIGPVTAGKIVARRNSKGPFTSISQLSEVGSFNKEVLELLKRHLIIK